MGADYNDDIAPEMNYPRWIQIKLVLKIYNNGTEKSTGRLQ